jgi:hypothetical protein
LHQVVKAAIFHDGHVCHVGGWNTNLSTRAHYWLIAQKGKVDKFAVVELGFWPNFAIQLTGAIDAVDRDVPWPYHFAIAGDETGGKKRRKSFPPRLEGGHLEGGERATPGR